MFSTLIFDTVWLHFHDIKITKKLHIISFLCKHELCLDSHATQTTAIIPYCSWDEKNVPNNYNEWTRKCITWFFPWGVHIQIYITFYQAIIRPLCRLIYCLKWARKWCSLSTLLREQNTFLRDSMFVTVKAYQHWSICCCLRKEDKNQTKLMPWKH